jgi:uncharacterized lipoprotein NlpE involved in copper resistance
MWLREIPETIKTLLIAAFLVTSGLTLMGCDDGAFENAGEEVDDTVDDAEDEL